MGCTRASLRGGPRRPRWGAAALLVLPAAARAPPEGRPPGGGVVLEARYLEAAAWALAGGAPALCARRPDFGSCTEPWGAAEAWRYAAANARAASGLAAGGPRLGAAAERASQAVEAFFARPKAEAFARAARYARKLERRVREAGASPQPLLFDEGAGLGVPFPLAAVVLPGAASAATATPTLQLRGGFPMPLLALAVRPSSGALVVEALALGVRHLEVPPALAAVVGQAIRASRVPRDRLFLSMPWEPPLSSERSLDEVLSALGTRRVDLLMLRRGSRYTDASWGSYMRSTWLSMERLKAQGKARALGVDGLRPDELVQLPRGGTAVEYARCAFTPYRPGPSELTWQQFSRRSIALVASSLLAGRPHALRPADDPHVRAVAERSRHSPRQVLIRWALQLGLAVAFHASKADHVSENVRVFDFGLPNAEMQLLSGLATLAGPPAAFGRTSAPRQEEL